MGIRVEALYEAAKVKYKLNLRCGQDGINNSSSWVYLAEDIQNISFLKGGELIITTGLFTQSEIGLYEFIRALSLHNCSGILLNVGKYLHTQDITPEIVSFCNINRIPLITMPWEIHLADIMQDFCKIFFQDRQADNDLDAAFLNALYQTQIPDGILRTMNQYGFPTQASYLVMVIANLQDFTSIASPLNSYGLKYHMFRHKNHHILIYNTGQKQLSPNDVIDIVCFCDSIIVGVSDVTKSLAEIGTAYQRACFALNLAEFQKRPFARFDETGMFQFLFCVSDTSLLREYERKCLEVLEQHDQEHNTEYLNTLHAFLLSDCNLIDTAERLHMHRNTVVYRIGKIKEILHTELDTSTTKFNLMLAFYIREYFSM